MSTLLIKHIASGQAFFTGASLMILVVLVSAASTKRRLWTMPVFFVGLVLVAISATPLPDWFYWVLAPITLIWLIPAPARQRIPNPGDDKPEDQQNAAEESPPRASANERRIAGAFVVAWLIAMALEVPYHITPSIPAAPAARLTIVADSVSAGMGENEAVTWPRLFAESHEFEVVDHSQMGATVSSAAKLMGEHPPQPGIVLLEMGGNDILGSTTQPGFEAGLHDLLNAVTGDDRVVVMLELPLPPFDNAYGQIQRRLAAQYDVALIPKRFLLNVLLSEATTLDSIHLSQQGHQRMADRVWTLLGPSLSRSPQIPSAADSTRGQ